MRMIRDSPPELARECPGPYASSSNTRFPRFARCHAVHAPNAPAPITVASYVFCPVIFVRSYLEVHPARILSQSVPLAPHLKFGSLNDFYATPMIVSKVSHLILRRCV